MPLTYSNPSQQLHCCKSHPTRSLRNTSIRCTLTALKEWAPAVKSLEDGMQTVLLRKGGIREPIFKPHSKDFLLFPTAFHTEGKLLKPEFEQKYKNKCEWDPKSLPKLQFSCLAEVTGAWTTLDGPKVLSALDVLHIYGPQFLDARLRWRPTQPLTILEVRAYRLPSPVVVDTKEEFWGCFSWVDIDAPLSISDLMGSAVPSMGDDAFAARQRVCREGLKTLHDLNELHIENIV